MLTFLVLCLMFMVSLIVSITAKKREARSLARAFLM